VFVYFDTITPAASVAVSSVPLLSTSVCVCACVCM